MKNIGIRIMRVNKGSKRIARKKVSRCKCYFGLNFLGTKKDFFKKFGIERCGNPGEYQWQRGTNELPSDLPMEAEVAGKRVKVCSQHLQQIKEKYRNQLGGHKEISQKEPEKEERG